MAILIISYLILGPKSKDIKTIESTLVDIKTITHDTKLFTFALPKGMNKLGLNIG